MNVQKEKRLLYWSYFSIGVLANFNVVLLPFFYHAKGMSEGQVALLLSSTYLSALVQPVFGYITDSTIGPKEMLKKISIGIVIVSVLLFFSNTFFTLFIFSFILSICRNLTFPLLDNISLSFSGKYNVEYGVLRKGGSIGFGFGVLLAVPVLLAFDVVYIVFLPFIIALILLLLLLNIEYDLTSSKSIVRLDEYKENIGVLFKSKRFVLLQIINLCLMGMSSLKLSYQSSLLDIMGVSVLYMAVLNFTTVLFEIVFMSKTQKMFRKNHLSFIITLMVIVSVSQNIFLLTSSSIILILLASSLHGIAMALYVPNFLSYISKVIPEKASSTGYILNNTVQSISTLIINSFIIAPLVFAGGTRFSFIIIISIMLLSLIPTFMLYRLDKAEMDN